MTNRVNPPKQLQLPPEVAKNKALKKAFDDRDYILFQLWKRVGGGEDWIEEVLTGLYEFDDLARIDVKQALIDDVVVITSNYTTNSSQTVICDNELTVSLNATPDDRELAKIIVSNGDVTISGNGRQLNKSDSQTVIYDDLITPAAVNCLYVIELDEWFIV